MTDEFPSDTVISGKFAGGAPPFAFNGIKISWLPQAPVYATELLSASTVPGAWVIAEVTFVLLELLFIKVLSAAVSTTESPLGPSKTVIPLIVTKSVPPGKLTDVIAWVVAIEEFKCK